MFHDALMIGVLIRHEYFQAVVYIQLNIPHAAQTCSSTETVKVRMLNLLLPVISNEILHDSTLVSHHLL